MIKPADRKKVLSWALYDWGNSAFATTVMAGFFPVFFQKYWSTGVAATDSTFRLGLANSTASLVIVVLAPVLGAIADRGSARKRFLLVFTALGVVMTGALYWAGEGQWLIAVTLYGLAVVGFSGAMAFYDSLLVVVAGRDNVDFVSALGYSLGYLGGGVLFAVNVWMTLDPAAFGLADAAVAVRVSFITVALWWALFAVPVFLFVDEPQASGEVSGWQAVAAGLAQLRDTFREVRRLRVVWMFLLAYWLYIDGVDTVIRMAVDYGMALGFDPNSLIVALLITQFVGFPAAVAMGKLGERLGAKTAIFIGIGVYFGVIVWGFFMQNVTEFYGLAMTIGLVQGGIQALSRSLYSRIIPHDKSAQFFGFYNLLGKFAAVIGPILLGTVGVLTGNPRMGLLSIILLFVAGAALLRKVDVARGEQAAREMEGS